jgi:hypothetical protein
LVKFAIFFFLKYTLGHRLGRLCAVCFIIVSSHSVKVMCKAVVQLDNPRSVTLLLRFDQTCALGQKYFSES